MKQRILATKGDVLSMYSTSKVNQQRNALKYYEAMQLRKSLGYGAVRISRAIKMPMGAVHYWLQGFEPKSVKGIKELESMGLLPLEIQDSKAFRQFVRTFGYRLADGCIYEQKRNNSYTGYVCFGEIEDALQFSNDCKEAWGIELKSHFGTNAYYIYLPASLARLMILTGSPVGDKTRQVFRLPNWIFQLSDELKFEFIDGLFAGDGSVPRLKPSGLAAESLKLALSSEKSIAADFSRSFMLDLWNLLCNLGIKASKPKVMYNQPMTGKDGKTTHPTVIRILTQKDNMINFLNKVSYRYNAKGNRAVKKALEGLGRA